MKSKNIPISFIKELAYGAGKILMRHFRTLKSTQIMHKGYKDFVTVVDRKSENYIISNIKKRFPHHAILAEESGGTEISKQEGSFWVIDPLDGTTNFIHGLPVFSVSIAYCTAQAIEAGVVYDPNHDEMFWAKKDQGAYLNGKKIHVTRSRKLENTLLATGFPFRRMDVIEPYIKTFRSLSMSTRGIRRGGSAALDLVHTACGRYDGFWEFGLNVWDIAGGVRILIEAGARVSDLSGGQQYLISGDIACANPTIHKAVVKKLKFALNR